MGHHGPLLLSAANPRPFLVSPTGNLIPRKRITLIDRLKHTQRQDEEIPLVRIIAHLADFESMGHAAISGERETADYDALAVGATSEAFDVETEVVVGGQNKA